MSNLYACLRQELTQLIGLRLDGLDAVVDEEGLPSPIQLAQDRVAHEAGGRFCDARLDRQRSSGGVSMTLMSARRRGPGSTSAESAWLTGSARGPRCASA